MINMYTIRNIYTILAFNFLVALLLPKPSLGQSVIIGYGYGKKWIEELEEYPLTGFPTNEQLDLNHVIASDIGCFGDGSLFTGKLPNGWNGNKNLWLGNLVNRAHAKGVKATSKNNLN